MKSIFLICLVLTTALAKDLKQLPSITEYAIFPTFEDLDFDTLLGEENMKYVTLGCFGVGVLFMSYWSFCQMTKCKSDGMCKGWCTTDFSDYWEQVNNGEI